MDQSNWITLVILASFWGSLFLMSVQQKNLKKMTNEISDKDSIERHRQLVELREIKELLKKQVPH